MTFDKMSSPADNPWRCDCALHWLRSWIDEEGQRLLSSAERRLVCTEPPRLSHLSLVEVPLNSLVCIPPLVQLEPRRLAVRLGESLRVSCHASGYPRPQVRKSSQKAAVGCHKCDGTKDLYLHIHKINLSLCSHSHFSLLDRANMKTKVFLFCFLHLNKQNRMYIFNGPLLLFAKLVAVTTLDTASARTNR